MLYVRTFALRSPHPRVPTARGDSVRAILAEWIGIHPLDIAIRVDPLGKPQVVCPDVRIHFNISHTGERGLLAASYVAPVGVDIEQPARIRDPQGLLQRIRAPRDGLASDDASRDLQLTAAWMWVRKEAVLKALGIGLRAPMRAVTLTPAGENAHRWRLAGHPSGTVTDLSMGPDHVAAVACITSTEPVVWRAPPWPPGKSDDLRLSHLPLEH